VLHILARRVDALGSLRVILDESHLERRLLDPCWGKQTCRILSILAVAAQARHTEQLFAAGRFISDRICFSP
jgi:hypothetical protein